MTIKAHIMARELAAKGFTGEDIFKIVNANDLWIDRLVAYEIYRTWTHHKNGVVRVMRAGA